MKVPAKQGQLPQPVQIALVVVGLLVFAAAVYFVVIAPKKSQASDVEARVAQMQSELEGNRSNDRVAEAQSAIEVASFFDLSKAMPEQPQVAELILELSAAARGAGIRFESMAVNGEPVARSGYYVQPVTLVFEGSYYQLADLLRRMRSLVILRNAEIQTSGRLITVDTLKFSEGAGGFPKLKADLTIAVYVYGALAGAAGTTTTGTETTTNSSDSSTSAAPTSGEAD